MESESIKLPQTTRALWYEVYSLRRSLKRRKDHNIEDYERLNAVCLLYTSDAADDLLCVDLGGRRIIKNKTCLSTPTI